MATELGCAWLSGYALVRCGVLPRPAQTDMRALDQKDVVRLLRSEVNRAGSQKEWAKENGVTPSSISMVLSGVRPVPSQNFIRSRNLGRCRPKYGAKQDRNLNPIAGTSHARVDARRSQPTSGKKWARKHATRGRKLATVAQPCGYPVDGQMDCLHHALVGIAGPVTLQQFDLYMVERIEVGKAVLDRARQQGILVEQCLLAGDGEQHFNRVLPFGTQPRKDSFAQLGVLDELRIA